MSSTILSYFTYFAAYVLQIGGGAFNIVRFSICFIEMHSTNFFQRNFC